MAERKNNKVRQISPEGSSVRRPVKSGMSPGDKFGRLTVVGESFMVPLSKQTRAMVVCRCQCGSVIIALCSSLNRGLTQSCGCWQLHQARRAATRHGYAPKGRQHPLYRLWSGVKNRCCNPREPTFRHYGGRGIRMCEEWLDNPELFIEWAAANGWRPGLQIDRIDNEKGYSPDNCRFVTSRTNNRNRRNNHRVTAFGETKVIAAWLEDFRCKVSSSVFWRRHRRGWRFDEALMAPAADNLIEVPRRPQPASED